MSLRFLKKSLASYYGVKEQIKERDKKGRKVCRWGDFNITTVVTKKT